MSNFQYLDVTLDNQESFTISIKKGKGVSRQQLYEKAKYLARRLLDSLNLKVRFYLEDGEFPVFTQELQDIQSITIETTQQINPNAFSKSYDNILREEENYARPTIIKPINKYDQKLLKNVENIFNELFLSFYHLPKFKATIKIPDRLTFPYECQLTIEVKHIKGDIDLVYFLEVTGENKHHNLLSFFYVLDFRLLDASYFNSLSTYLFDNIIEILLKQANQKMALNKKIVEKKKNTLFKEYLRLYNLFRNKIFAPKLSLISSVYSSFCAIRASDFNFKSELIDISIYLKNTEKLSAIEFETLAPQEGKDLSHAPEKKFWALEAHSSRIIEDYSYVYIKEIYMKKDQSQVLVLFMPDFKTPKLLIFEKGEFSKTYHANTSEIEIITEQYLTKIRNFKRLTAGMMKFHKPIETHQCAKIIIRTNDSNKPNSIYYLRKNDFHLLKPLAHLYSEFHVIDILSLERYPNTVFLPKSDFKNPCIPSLVTISVNYDLPDGRVHKILYPNENLRPITQCYIHVLMDSFIFRVGFRSKTKKKTLFISEDETVIQLGAFSETKSSPVKIHKFGIFQSDYKGFRIEGEILEFSFRSKEPLDEQIKQYKSGKYLSPLEVQKLKVYEMDLDALSSKLG